MEGEVSEGRTPLEEARSWGVTVGCFEMEVSEAVWMNHVKGAGREILLG